MGLRYSRHVDDLTISSRFVPSEHVILTAVSTLAAMVLNRGMRLKRKKHHIGFNGERRQFKVACRKHAEQIARKYEVNMPEEA
jgi:hypothetical protein